ncbi:MAG: GTP-binding protein, partial [Polyangiaceae bacterium]
MASLNPLTRELVFKIVFYGPGLGGKTTTLQYVHGATRPEHRGELVSLATPTDRTLYFDFLPVRVEPVQGMHVRLQLFTVPGQVYYSATRKLVLTGADGIVFVADSQQARIDANQESLEDLNANLAEHDRSLSKIPHTFQWNKRDLKDISSVEELDRRFNLFSAPGIATSAIRGQGVFEGLEEITKLVLEHYKAELPRVGRDMAMALDEADSEGIADAIRGIAEGSKRSPHPRPRPVEEMRPSPSPQGIRPPSNRGNYGT